ncbi:putative bifunctional diguanylate cyclase/phosphodiesterase [Lysobacter korlensis]|uniref:Bifunctional diguanylate cyclase/phosphodiesterase n=1 Tax=Lysobacter korlensis TaxID=553636 RepID=A0ABV6RRE3_9GAMM
MAGTGSLTLHPRTLRGQTLLAVFGVHALIIPLFFGGLVFFVNQAFTAQFVNQIRSETRLFASLIPSDFDHGAAREIFYASAAGSTLMSVEILSKDGDVHWTFESPMVSDAPPAFREDFLFGEHGDDVYFIATPLFDADGEPAAQLRLAFDETPTLEQIAIVNRRAALLTLGYLVLTLLLAAYWIHRLNRPMRALGLASRRVASGEFREAIEVRTSLPEILSLASDINHMRAELLKNTDEMQHMAMHDGLTGLPNRALLADRVLQAMAQAQRADQSFTLLFMDLDHFKEINDTLGHGVGDHVLRQIPGRIQPLLRAGDTMARLGGDEFAFVLQDADADTAVAIVERLVDAMKSPFEVHGQQLHVGQSIGIAIFPEHARQFDELLREADVAMYAAKVARRPYAVFSPDIDPHSRERLELVNELRRDIERGRLRVHYQPQVEIGSGRLVGIEALVRWHPDQREPSAPDEFIPIAERLGLMDALTRLVVRQSFADFASASQLRGTTLSINLSTSNLRDPTLPGYFADMLREFGLDASQVVLEVTEHESIVEATNALEQLAALRAIGFGLAIDDFGKGHASFNYLKHLPATELKIDRSFVADMAHDRHDHSLVAAIVALARDLGLCVVAEGVPDGTVLEMLRKLGCDRAQGFYIARPMPMDDLLAMLAAGRAQDGGPLLPAGIKDQVHLPVERADVCGPLIGEERPA